MSNTVIRRVKALSGKIAFLLICGVMVSPGFVHGHGTASPPDVLGERAITFPDTKDYQTLIVDLHTHSVFSDGHVWPKIRVDEALKDGLDALAITEHLEYQPHRADLLNPDRNRAYAEAASAAEGSDLLVIKGSEITRQAPAGHINAIFIKDANQLINIENLPESDSDIQGYYNAAQQWPAQNAVEAAHAQGAFIFWNHPYWTRQAADGIARINNFHSENARNGILHGIEIANGNTYSEEAFAIALAHDLALIGVSDVHDLIDWDYKPHEGGHRPVTLVLARDKSLSALKEALFAKRTVVWFRNTLIGRAPELIPVLKASLTVSSLSYLQDTKVAQVTLSNRSDMDMALRYTGEHSLMFSADRITVPAHSEARIQVKPGAVVDTLELPFVVENALTAPKQNPTITLISTQ
ncbi:MAG: Sb-PDE family phosphodiesterase [Pseudomonadales bacterium]|nr:Sb-PDE family phosphodiesterase [Pseudomonadales bacterium]